MHLIYAFSCRKAFLRCTKLAPYPRRMQAATRDRGPASPGPSAAVALARAQETFATDGAGLAAAAPELSLSSMFTWSQPPPPWFRSVDPRIVESPNPLLRRLCHTVPEPHTARPLPPPPPPPGSAAPARLAGSHARYGTATAQQPHSTRFLRIIPPTMAVPPLQQRCAPLGPAAPSRRGGTSAATPLADA